MSTATAEAPATETAPAKTMPGTLPAAALASAGEYPWPEWCPEVRKGDIVEWWREEKRPAHPDVAIVTFVHPNGRVSLNGMVKGSRWVQVENTHAVPHLNDPTRFTGNAALVGRWDLRPVDKLRAKEREDLAALVALQSAKISELAGRLEQLDGTVETLRSELMG